MANWVTNLFSAGASSVIDSVGNAGDKLFTSDQDRLQFKNEYEEIKQKPMLMQAMANVKAAQSRHWFTSGGRPWLLWVAGMGLFFFFPVRYAVGTYIWAKLSLQGDEMLVYPFLGTGLMELVGMLLGLGTLRTIEKLQGVSK
jgi:hypothetical protein